MACPRFSHDPFGITSKHQLQTKHGKVLFGFWCASLFSSGTQLDAIGLRFGVGHSWHDVKTDRSVAFGGFADKLSASYDASTTYAFGEVGYAMVMDRVTFEPFANVAFVHLDTDGFTESGGPELLSVPTRRWLRRSSLAMAHTSLLEV